MTESNICMMGISITPKEREIVEQLEKSKGINNFSAALRIIINEWAEYQKRMAIIIDKGIKDGEVIVNRKEVLKRYLDLDKANDGS